MEKSKENHELHNRPLGVSGAFSKLPYKQIYIVLGIALILFSLYSIYQVFSFGTLLEEKLAEAREAARPAEIQLVVITTSSCKDCYGIGSVVDTIEATKVNITDKKELDFSSEEAKLLIDKYGIEKVPTVIVTGEISKSKSLNSKLKQIGKESQEALIFTNLEPPFIDTATGEVKGRVVLTYLKKEDCEKCFDLTPLINQLTGLGLKFKEQKSITIDSEEGKDLLDKYSIKKVPAIIMDSEAGAYTAVVDGWARLGSIENDGHFVMREISPPYYSVEDGKIRGLVSMTVVVDKACDECYDPNEFHKPILQRMGVAFGEEKEIDVSSVEGQSLINKYSIEKVPTIVLKGDVEEYPVLVNAWKGVGTKEADGTYVFRKVEIARQTYVNLSNNEIIKQQQ